MKRVNKIIAFVMMSALVVLSGCTEEYEYQPAQKGEGGNTYIVGKTYTQLGYKANDPLVFQIKLQRSDAGNAESIKLISDNPNIKLPATVEFQANEKSKTVEIPFECPEANTQKVVISVAPENASHYGVTSATYILEHYKEHKADYESNWFGQTWNNVTVLEAGDRHYKLLIPLRDDKGNVFQPIEMVVQPNNDVYVYPQPAYAATSFRGDVVMLYVVGNMKGDASEKYEDADLEGVSSFAGTYNPQEKAFYLNLFWYAPNYGWWGWNNETVYMLN